LQIETTARQATKPPSGSLWRSPSPTRWMIASDDANGRIEPLCVQAGTAMVLAVFSFEEEAEMFLHLGGYDGGRWRVRESGAGELVSVLCGPCIDVWGVALDPLPEMLKDGTLSLVGVGRRRFLRQLLARGRSERPRAERTIPVAASPT
jgi:hypothetical protein